MITPVDSSEKKMSYLKKKSVIDEVDCESVRKILFQKSKPWVRVGNHVKDTKLKQNPPPAPASRQLRVCVGACFVP